VAKKFLILGNGNFLKSPIIHDWAFLFENNMDIKEHIL
jgi:hypothetical protein